MPRIAWLNGLPPAFCGTSSWATRWDAMPVHLVRASEAGIEEAGSRPRPAGSFEWVWRPASGPLLEAARVLELPPGYLTEIALVARGFVASLGEALERGLALFIDYGFPRHGTTIRQRHRNPDVPLPASRHPDPFFLPGLQDITSHVDYGHRGMAWAQHGAARLHHPGAVPAQLRHRRFERA